MINVDKLKEYVLKDNKLKENKLKENDLKEKVLKDSKKRVMRLGQFIEYKWMYPLIHNNRKLTKYDFYR